MSFRSWVCFLLSITVGFSQIGPTFQSEIDLVNITCSVRGANGALVSDLNKDDFEILEDGIPQPIKLFARDLDLPLSLGLLLDFSGSQEHFIKQHQNDLRTFLESILQSRDRCFLVCFTDYVRLVSESSSVTDLMDKLHIYSKDHRKFPELDPDETREGGTALFDAIHTSSSQKLKQVNGRKALIIFSDGEDTSSAHDDLDTIRAAEAADVRIYAFRYTETKKGRLTASNRYGTSVLAHIADETGGTAFDMRKIEMSSAFQQIQAELRSMYELAFVSTNPVRDGSFRKLTVRMKRPGLTVRAKSGYYAQ